MRPIHHLLLLTLIAAHFLVLMRAILRPHRDPASRLAWVMVIVMAPLSGMFLYLLFGEARVSVSRRKRGMEIDKLLPRPPGDKAATKRLLARQA